MGVLGLFGDVLGVGKNSLRSLERLLFVHGEEDELLNVCFETLDVSFNRLVAFVGSSDVDCDSDSSGESGAETGHFEFLNGESSSFAWLTAISESALADNGSQGIHGFGENCLCFLFSLLNSSHLSCWLVEPGFDKSLPVFAEMGSLEWVVVGWHYSFIKFIRN